MYTLPYITLPSGSVVLRRCYHTNLHFLTMVILTKQRLSQLALKLYSFSRHISYHSYIDINIFTATSSHLVIHLSRTASHSAYTSIKALASGRKGPRRG